jgi:RNA polymerase sigma factor (sigma-70 family)
MDPAPLNSTSQDTSYHVRRALEGDHGSLAWVVSRLTPLLLAHAAYRLGPTLRTHHDPEDLVNDAWLVALPRLRELAGVAGRQTPALLRFLTTTILFRIQHLVRKHVRGAASPADDGPPPVSEVPAETSGVLTSAVRRERMGLVASCLEELEPKDREVLVLRGIEQQSNATVALLLDLTPAGVSMRYARALERLRARLPGSVFDELAEE